MEKYKVKPIEELAGTLKILSKSSQAPGLSTELREFVCMLKAHKLRHTADAHAFCKCGSMDILLELLQRCEAGSGDVVVVLGTIGNLCALHQDARNIVMTKGLERIAGYLQSSTTSDAIGTTARVLANLAMDRPHISALHKHRVVAQLSQLLGRPHIDINCKRNVIRALRLCCRARECLDELKQSDGVPLILDCLKSDHVELAMCAIQAIEVSSADGDPDILQYLCNKEVMQCVIRYCNHSKVKVRRRAVNVLLNVAKVLDGRIALSSAGGIETLVAFMESSDKQSGIFSEVVCALCTCCRDVISRQRLRDCGGLERLISMLADPQHAPLHRNVMSALVCYYFDENTLKLMVTKMGLQQTLCYHLKTMMSELRELSTYQSGSNQEDTMNESGLETSSEMCEMMETTLSPVESERSSAPSCDTPPPSKRPRLEAESDSSGTPVSFLDSLLSSPSPYRSVSSSSSTSSSRPLNSPLVGDVNSSFESQVILLVSRISHMKDCLVIQSYSDSLLTVLDYFIWCKPPNLHISKVLTRVFMNLHCFQNIISSLVPSKIHKIFRQSPSTTSSITATTSSISLESATGSILEVDGDFTGLCQGLMEHLAKNAESPYGQGVLAHLLLRGSEREKQASSLSIPLLCRSTRVCQKLMVDYGAFQILCEVLNNPGKEETWEMGVDSMLAVGHSMHLKQVPRHRRRYTALPPQLERKFPFSRLDFSFKDLSLSDTRANPQCGSSGDANSAPVPCHCRYLDTDHRPFDLTMVLHSPSGQLLRVQAHKTTLMEESDVFRVMLAGSYKESSCSEVHIYSIAPCGFLSVIHHIYGCGWDCKTVLGEVYRRSKKEAVRLPPQSDFLSESSDVLLEAVTSACGSREEGIRARHCLQVLACAGRFLLPSLITLSEHAAVKYLCPENIVPMFHFAQFHQCFCLAESCVRVLLSLPHLKLRTEVFKELLNSSEGEAAVHIILLFLTAADYS